MAIYDPFDPRNDPFNPRNDPFNPRNDPFLPGSSTDPYLPDDPFGILPARRGRASSPFSSTELSIDDFAPIPSEISEEDRQGMLESLGQATLGGVSAVGNLLDLPGSTVRDWLTGTDLGAAQWATPFTDENRITGREMLTDWGVTPKNKETGISGWFSDPMEGVYDIGGFLAEIATDPLTYAGGLGLLAKGAGGLGKLGKVIMGAGLIDDVVEVAARKAAKSAIATGKKAPKIGWRESRRITKLDDIIEDTVLQDRFKPLGGTLQEGKDALTKELAERAGGIDKLNKLRGESVGGAIRPWLPGVGSFGPYSPLGGKVGRAMDTAGDFISDSVVGRGASALFDSGAHGKFDKYTQQISRLAKNSAEGLAPKMAVPFQELGEHLVNVRQAVMGSGLGDEILKRSVVGGSPLSIGANVGDIIKMPGLGDAAKIMKVDGDDVFLRMMDDSGVYQTIKRQMNTLDGASVIDNAGVISQVNTDLIDDALQSFQGALKETPAGASNAWDSWLITDVTRTGTQGRYTMRGMIDGIADPAAKQNVMDLIGQTTAKMDNVTNPLRQRLVEKGVKIGDVDSYLVRYITESQRGRISKGLKNVQEPAMVRELMRKPGSQLPREAALRDVPKHIIQRMYDDTVIKRGIDDLIESGADNDEVIAAVAEMIQGSPEYSRYLKDDWNEMARVVDDLSETATGQVRQANHAEAISESIMRNGGTGRMYVPDLVQNYSRYVQDMVNLEATVDGMHAVIARNATNVNTGGMVSITKMLSSVGHDVKLGKKHLAKILGTEESSVGKLFVPKELVNQVRATRAVTTPGPMMELFENFITKSTDAFKGGVTLPFPAFGVRNHTSGQFVNVTSGDVRGIRDLADYIKTWFLGRSISRNPTADTIIPWLKDANGKAMTHADALKEAKRYDFLGGDIHFMDVAAPGGPKKAFVDVTKDSLTPDWRLQGPRGMAGSLKDVWQESGRSVSREPHFWKSMWGLDQPIGEAPGRISGKVRQAGRSVLETGSNFNRAVEYQNRFPMWLYLKKKGMSSKAASRRVKDLQFDYSELAPFEKRVMKKVFPFYAFTRKMAPLFYQNLANQPAGLMGQTIRATRMATSKKHILPSYIGEQTAFQLFKPEEEGAVSYITGLGLAHEDTLGYLSGLSSLGQGDLKQFARRAYSNVMARSNPLLKSPMEFLQGTSFFQTGPGGTGRSLDDMDPVLGRLIANVKQNVTGRPQKGKAKPLGGKSLGPIIESGLSASPFSRVFSTARQLSDPRKNIKEKAMNFLTGVKSTTLSPYQLDYAAKQAMQEVSKSGGYGRVYSSPYIDRYALAEMLAAGRITREDYDRALLMQAEYKSMRGHRDKTKRDAERQRRLQTIMSSGAF